MSLLCQYIHIKTYISFKTIENSDSILRVIVGLYRHKVGCAPSALAIVNLANSGSHSSDSGINEYIRMDTLGPQNTSYNTERLEAHLNPSNVRQTVNKYLKLKNELNASRMIHNTIGDELTPNDIQLNDCQTLMSDSLDKTLVSSSDDKKFSDFVTSATIEATEETLSLTSNDKVLEFCEIILIKIYKMFLVRRQIAIPFVPRVGSLRRPFQRKIWNSIMR